MDDGIIKGTGNSRYLKSAISPDASWEEAREKLISGTFHIDFNGIDPEGWEKIGTPNDKANLLTDETAELFGGVETVNEALAALATIVKSECAKIDVGEYDGTGTYGEESPTIINLSFKPALVLL